MDQYRDFVALGGQQALVRHYREADAVVQRMKRVQTELGQQAPQTGSLLTLVDQCERWTNEVARYRNRLFRLHKRIDRQFKGKELIAASWQELLQTPQDAPSDFLFELLIAQIGTAPKGELSDSVIALIQGSNITEFWTSFRASPQGQRFSYPDASFFVRAPNVAEIYTNAKTNLSPNDGTDNVAPKSGKQATHPPTRKELRELIEEMSKQAGDQFQNSVENISYIPKNASLTAVLLLTPVLLAVLNHTFLTALLLLEQSVKSNGGLRSSPTFSSAFLLRTYSGSGRLGYPVKCLDVVIRWGTLVAPIGSAGIALGIYYYLHEFLPRVFMEVTLRNCSLAALVIMVYELCLLLPAYKRVLQSGSSNAQAEQSTADRNTPR